LAAFPTERSPVGLRLPSPGPVEEVVGFAEGRFQVQDEAAQLVGLYAAIPEGARVLDACAAPGGKACHQAETHPVLAVDLYPAKLEKIRSEARRLRLDDRIEGLAHDASGPSPAGSVPPARCSRTTRRSRSPNPSGRWTRCCSTRRAPASARSGAIRSS